MHRMRAETSALRIVGSAATSEVYVWRGLEHSKPLRDSLHELERSIGLVIGYDILESNETRSSYGVLALVR